MKPIDFILIGVVAVAVIAVVISLIVKKKKGESGCGCGCSGCPNAGKCGAQNLAEEKEKKDA